eukprot:GFYU01023050.1.p1 GENE.GFYU01023050.1~~GFYU01023050.1.p1  ORF type:complete len:637 (-),score=94.63 GFYU01023050.1:80-1990(-)
MKDSEVNQVVLHYLEKKGYQNASAEFKTETKVQSLGEMAFTTMLDSEANVTNRILCYYSGELQTPGRYEESYVLLKDWIQGCLDMYKNELIIVLYPMFVHCHLEMISKGFQDGAKIFMQKHKHEHLDLHGTEIARLEAVSTPQHVLENELVQLYLKHKLDLQLSSSSFELLLSFLLDSKLMLLLSIINSRLNIRIMSNEPSDHVQVAGLFTGSTAKGIDDMNKKNVRWGVLEDAEYIPERIKDKDQEQQGPDAKKIKLEPDSADAKIETKVPIPQMTDKTALNLFQDIRKRVVVNSTANPSVSFYTLLNSNQSVTSIDMSNDASIMSAGFSSSAVKIWDLQKSSESVRENGEVNITIDPNDSELYNHHMFVGHSGPVFATNISLDNRFLISASEDNTARLWSFETKSNLVCYKGHNYPIWDVQFSPLGYYFASASHDRSARLWTTDHIYPLRVFAGHLSDVDCVQFHPNCNYLATGSSDKSVRLWDVQSGSCVRMFVGHSGSVSALAISPDGKTMASAGDDRSIHIWDLGSGKKIKVLYGHQKCIYSLSFSAEGSILASGGADCSVRLWDVHKQPTSIAAHRDIPLEDRRTTPSKDSVSQELVKTFYTKSTPVHKVKFTQRNLILAAGAFHATETN